MHRLTYKAGIFQRKTISEDLFLLVDGLLLVYLWWASECLQRALRRRGANSWSEALTAVRTKNEALMGGKRWLIESGGSSSCMGGHTRCARQQTRTVQVLLHEEMFFTAILLTMREATRRQPANIKTNKLGLQGLHLLTPSLILQPLSLVLNCVPSRGDWMGSLGFTLHHPQKDPPPFFNQPGWS